MTNILSADSFAAYEQAKRAESAAFTAVESAKRALAAAEHARDIASCSVRDIQAQLLRDARAILGPISRQANKPTLDSARYTKSDVRE